MKSQNISYFVTIGTNAQINHYSIKCYLIAIYMDELLRWFTESINSKFVIINTYDVFTTHYSI